MPRSTPGKLKNDEQANAFSKRLETMPASAVENATAHLGSATCLQAGGRPRPRKWRRKGPLTAAHLDLYKSGRPYREGPNK